MTTNSYFKKNILHWLGAALLQLGTLDLVAAPTDAPPVPRLAAAPSSSAWTIAYQYKTPNPYLKSPDPSLAVLYKHLLNQNPRTLSLQITKSGDNRKELVSFDNQTQQIQWIVGKLLVTQNAQATYSVWDSRTPGTPPFTHDFQSLDWIDKADYGGHQNYQGIDCCVYHSKDTPGGDLTAYIDAKTGLPVGVQEGAVTLTYTFAGSGGDIEIPAAVLAQIQRYLQISP
jgi:hypothetical protein